jgi:hypothetical protein
MTITISKDTSTRISNLVKELTATNDRIDGHTTGNTTGNTNNTPSSTTSNAGNHTTDYIAYETILEATKSTRLSTSVTNVQSPTSITARISSPIGIIITHHQLIINSSSTHHH